MASDSSVILEGSMKFRDGKKWKPRWGVLTRLSPVADCMQLLLYRDQKERLKEGYTKGSLSLQNFYGCESGFVLDKECNTLALIIKDGVFVFAFDTRERLLQWQAKISLHLGEAVQFEVEITSAPPKSKCGIALGENAPRSNCSQTSSTSGNVVTSQIGNGLGATLHLVNARFCLTSADAPPPKMLHQWEIGNLRRFGVVDGHFCWEGGTSCGPKGVGVHVIATAQRNEIEEAFKLAAKGTLLQPGKRTCNRKVSSKQHTAPGSPKSTHLSHGESKHSLLSSSVMASPSLGGPQMRRMLRDSSACRCATVWSSTESGSSGDCSHFHSAVSRPDTPDTSTIFGEKTRSMAHISCGTPATPDPTTPKKMMHAHLRHKPGFSPSWKMDGMGASDDSGHASGSVATSSRSSESEYCPGMSFSGTPTPSVIHDIPPSENYDKPRSFSIPVAVNSKEEPSGFVFRGPSKIPTSMSFCERCTHCSRPKMMHGMCCEAASSQQESQQQGNLRNRLGLIVPTRQHIQGQPQQIARPGGFPDGNFYHPRTPGGFQQGYAAPGQQRMPQQGLLQPGVPSYRHRFYDVPRTLHQQQPRQQFMPRQYSQQSNGWRMPQRPIYNNNGVQQVPRRLAGPVYPSRCPMVSAQMATRAANGGYPQQQQLYANLPRPAAPAPGGRCTGNAAPMGNYANLEFAETLDLYENVKRPGDNSHAPVLPPRAHPPLATGQQPSSVQHNPAGNAPQNPCDTCPSCTSHQQPQHCSVAVGDDYVFMAPLVSRPTAIVQNGVHTEAATQADQPPTAAKMDQACSPTRTETADQVCSPVRSEASDQVCSPARSESRETADTNVDEIYVAMVTRAAIIRSPTEANAESLQDQEELIGPDIVSGDIIGPGPEEMFVDLSYVCGFSTFPRMKRYAQEGHGLIRRSISLPGSQMTDEMTPLFMQPGTIVHATEALVHNEISSTRDSSSSEDSGVSTGSASQPTSQEADNQQDKTTRVQGPPIKEECQLAKVGSSANSLSPTRTLEPCTEIHLEEVKQFTKESAI